MFLSTLLSLRCFVKLICAHSTAAVISHLSAGKHAMDEEGFQRTMRYIFTFIEKVTILSPLPSQQLTAAWPIVINRTGKASGEYRREALPALPAQRGHAPMARRCVLSVASAVQVRAFGEEARRGPALLPRQAARRGRLRPLPRDPSQGAAFGKSQSTHRKIFNTLKKKKKQARSNKAANKPDSELNEFESVRLFCPVFFL